MDLSVIVISYNTKKLTTACLESVIKETFNINFEIIVIDNASTDGSAEAISSQFPEVKLIVSQTNLGFAKANNEASKIAIGDYLLLLNPDTVIQDRAIEKLILFANNNKEAKIWGGRTIFPDGTLNRTSCYNSPTLLSLLWQAIGLSYLLKGREFFCPETFGNWNFDTIRTVDIITGCFLLTHREFWTEMQGFDPLFFMYGEEVDFCLRAKKNGARPLFTPSATIIHYGGASETSSSTRLVKVFKAKVTLIKKHWPPTQSYIGVKLLFLSVLIRAVGFKIAGIFFNRIKQRKGKWQTVWRERANWLQGFEV